MQKHDSGYKYLFSNKTIFKELMQSFVNEDFVKGIDFNSLELIDKSFVSKEFIKRESDIIYKLKIKEEDVYIYVLLEFQSYVDKTIPVRMLLYILQLYDLLMRSSRKGKLPNIFPILLYNGIEDWNIPCNIRDLIDNKIPERYIPSFEYYKIIEKEISDERLLEIKNLVSAVIYLENKRDKKGLTEAIGKIVELIKNENIIDIKQFTIWLNKMFESKIKEEDIIEIKNIMEVNSMLATLVDNIKQEEFEKGIEKGIEKGKKENAKNMLEKGFDAKIISEITGLSIHEIEKL